MRIIPEEILVNILSRLPAKSVGCSRCVSKLWHRVLCEQHFIKDHLDRTKQFIDNELLILIPDTAHTLCSASIARHSLGDSTALATDLGFVVSPDLWQEGIPGCDGLILIEDCTDKRLIINPTTKETRELVVSPYALDPHASFTMYGLGYDHVGNDYKVVTLSYYNTDNEYEPDSTEMFANVYSIRNGTWKQVESSPYDHAVGHLVSGVFVSGCVHWVASTTSDYSSVIVAFDLSEEKFHELPATSSVEGEKFVLNRLVVLEGCLCLCPSSRKKETDIWVMKEYGVKQSWTKFSIVADTASEFKPILCMSRQRELVMVKDEETVAEKLVMYNLNSSTFKDIIMHGVNDEFHTAGSFLETLVSPYYGVIG